jgi:hypothetical protein
MITGLNGLLFCGVDMSTKYHNSKDVPNDVLIARLNELSDAICAGKDSKDMEFTRRIQAECDRDADLVIAEAARRLELLTANTAAIAMTKRPTGRVIPDLTGKEHVCEWQQPIKAKHTAREGDKDIQVAPLERRGLVER